MVFAEQEVCLSSVTLARFIVFTGSCPLAPSKYMPTVTSTWDLHTSHRNGDYGWYFPILLSSSPLFPFCSVMLVWESAKCFPGAPAHYLLLGSAVEGLGDCGGLPPVFGSC